MNETTTQPCPPWCRSDHDSITAHVSDAGGVNFGDRGLDSIWASAILAGHHKGRPVVAVTSHRYDLHDSPYLEVPALHADGLAGMVELLADLTPEQHRELASAIRKAAELAAEGRPPLGINPCCAHCDHDPGQPHIGECITCQYDLPDYDRN